MADKPITVDVPEDRVPEFYAWFAEFLAAGVAERGGRPLGSRRFGHRGGGPGGRGPRHDPAPWTDQDADVAGWFYAKLAPPARELFELLLKEPGKRWSGNDLARELGSEKGAHGIAGVLAWPGRYARKAGREFPIATTRREDGGTDYWLEPELAELFSAARPPG